MSSLLQTAGDNITDIPPPVEEGSRCAPAPPGPDYTIIDSVKYPDEAFTAHRKAAPESFRHEHIDLRNALKSSTTQDLKDDQYINCFVSKGEGFTATKGCDSMTNAFTISTNVECFPTWRQTTDVLIPIKHTHKGWSENHFPHPPRPKGLPKGPEIRHLDITKTWKGLSMAEANELIIWEMAFRATLAAFTSSKLDFIEGYVVDIEHGLRGKDWPVFRRLPFNTVDLAERLVKIVKSQPGYRGLFESLGDLQKWAVQFICLHDCFTGGECAVNELLMGVKVLPYGMRNMGYKSPGSTVDIRWEPHYLSFDGTDWKCVEGHEFNLIPQYNCAPIGGTVMSVKFSTSSRWLTWDPTNQRFFGIMPFFSDRRTRQFFDDLTITCNNPGVYSYSVLITVCGNATIYFGSNIRFEQAVRARITVDVLRRDSPEVISRLPHEMELFISGRSGGRMFLPHFSVAPKQGPGDSRNGEFVKHTEKPDEEKCPRLPPSEPMDYDDPCRIFGGTKLLLRLGHEEACKLVLNTPMPPWPDIIAARRKRAKEAADPSPLFRRRILPPRVPIPRQDSSSSWPSCRRHRAEGTDSSTSMSGGLITRSNPSVHSQRSILPIHKDNAYSADSADSQPQHSQLSTSTSSSHRDLTPTSSSDNDKHGYTDAPPIESVGASCFLTNSDVEAAAQGREQCQGILNMLRHGPRSPQVKDPSSPPDEGNKTSIPHHRIWKPHDDSVQPVETQSDGESSPTNSNIINTPPESPQPLEYQNHDITLQRDTSHPPSETTMPNRAGIQGGLSTPPHQSQESTTLSNDVDSEQSSLMGTYFICPTPKNIADRLDDQDSWILEVPSCIQISDRPPMDMEPFREIMERMTADIGMPLSAPAT
ncbi:hypothetical protein McanMca71_000907 [Microsporum canis]|uniref:Uncharacterized protein n=1 Tax=Arthroderma otae (strain ATCC MYA-4605 / CBS 113480) TaxID=554155 RepID=C5FI61_ARTOC|nr:uncharacterized protein MCYG_01860 [Microsporum canis CBS 113480]EEQ29041.1 predicted protein [Microsporum canis CBS 113480]